MNFKIIKFIQIFDQVYLTSEVSKKKIFSDIYDHIYNLPTVLCDIICDYCTNYFEFTISVNFAGDIAISHPLLTITYSKFSQVNPHIYFKTTKEKYFDIIKTNGDIVYTLYVYNEIIKIYQQFYNKLSQIHVIRGPAKYTNITGLIGPTGTYSKYKFVKEYISRNYSNTISDYGIFMEEVSDLSWVIFIKKDEYINDLFTVMNYLFEIIADNKLPMSLYNFEKY